MCEQLRGLQELKYELYCPKFQY